MENLFSANIAIENENVNYHVFFDNEKYVFQSQSGNEFPTFSLKREHDAWHNPEFLPTDLKEQAIDALGKYLFKQH
jgi:hypothetical protein